MKNIFGKRAVSALLMTLMTVLIAGSAAAQKSGENKEQMKEARTEAREATAVSNKMMKKPDDFIPRELLEKAQGHRHYSRRL